MRRLMLRRIGPSLQILNGRSDHQDVLEAQSKVLGDFCEGECFTSSAALRTIIQNAVVLVVDTRTKSRVLTTASLDQVLVRGDSSPRRARHGRYREGSPGDQFSGRWK